MTTATAMTSKMQMQISADSCKDQILDNGCLCFFHSVSHFECRTKNTLEDFEKTPKRLNLTPSFIYRQRVISHKVIPALRQTTSQMIIYDGAKTRDHAGSLFP